MAHDQVRRRRRERAGATVRQPVAPPGPEFAPEEIGEASTRLPERQREALALRGLEVLSYEEIAAIMEVSPSVVAQLIARARINLRDELSGTSLASVAPSPECERALPLIAMREDGQLEAASGEAAWLDSHLAGCGRCRLAVKEMREAAVSYSAWAPLAAASWPGGETIAKAVAPAGIAPPAEPERGKPRRRATLAAGLALLLLAGLAVALVEGNPSATPADPSAGTASHLSTGAPRRGARAGGDGKAKAGGARRKTRRTAARTIVGATAPAPGLSLVQAPVEGSAPSQPHQGHHTGATGIRQAGQPRAPKPKPAAAPAPAAPPAPSPAPTAEQPPPAGESTKGPHRKHEPPGKQPGHHLR